MTGEGGVVRSSTRSPRSRTDIVAVFECFKLVGVTLVQHQGSRCWSTQVGIKLGNIKWVATYVNMSEV